MTDPTCPRCRGKGRRVTSVTLRGVLVHSAQHHVDAAEPFQFCTAESCPVVYYAGSIELSAEHVRVPVFQKSSDPASPICYCFGFTVRDVRDDARRHGSSTIADEVAQKCRAGLERCEERNPQGTCCLGNVRRVARAAVEGAGDGHDGGCGTDCRGD